MVLINAKGVADALKLGKLQQACSQIMFTRCMEISAGNKICSTVNQVKQSNIINVSAFNIQV